MGNKLNDELLQDFKIQLFKEIYPVGSIYITYEDKTITDIHNMFGGTWVQIEGRVLLGAGTSPEDSGTTYSVKGTGGTKDLVIPYHRHGVSKITNGSTDDPGNHTHSLLVINGSSSNYRSMRADTRYQDLWQSYSGQDQISGGGAHTHTVTIPAHNTQYAGTSGNATNANMPPYLVVKIFRRTAL